MSLVWKVAVKGSEIAVSSTYLCKMAQAAKSSVCTVVHDCCKGRSNKYRK